MAAGQQKKRLISSSLHDHYRGKKKKKTDSSDYVLNLRSQIYLEWNDSQKKAVAKREQIGLTWADTAPFVDSIPQGHLGLADVFRVPQEIYSLNNLMEVLSYEVWATCLSESERKLLTQFLPSGTGAEQAVQSLLSGANHHFGNPFLRWSTLLCSGHLHPDDILQRKRRIRSNKKQYYLELNKYHTDMLEDLKKWKDKWTSCDNPEQLWSKALIKPKERSLPISSGKGKEILQKTCIRNGDMAKYMSYIKINKRQLEAIRSSKHSGDGIQSKTLNHVLGDIKSFHIHPYEALEEEERTKLCEHWLHIVKKDLPKAYEAWKKKRSHEEQLRKCLEQELSGKRTVIIDKLNSCHEIEAENPEISLEERIETSESEHDPTDIHVQEDATPTTNLDNDNQLERVPSLNSYQELRPKALMEAAGQDILIFGDKSTVISEFDGKENLVEIVEPNASSSPVKGMWQSVDAMRYKSPSDIPVEKLGPIEECRDPITDLARHVEHESRGSDDASLFSLYASQRRDDFLPSFTKGPEIYSSYPPEHLNELKQPALQFLMVNGGLAGALQIPNHIQEQHNLLEQNHAREREHLYVRQMMNKSLYSNGRYPSQEVYSSPNGDSVDRNWFPDGHRTHNNYWSGMEPSNSGTQCLGDGGTSDGSLFSVLSACRNRQSQSQGNPTNTEQLMEARNFVHNSNDSVYGYAPHQFKSSNNHEAATVSTATLHVPWMSYQPQQSPSLQDSIGKPFVRSWNQ